MNLLGTARTLVSFCPLVENDGCKSRATAGDIALDAVTFRMVSEGLASCTHGGKADVEPAEPGVEPTLSESVDILTVRTSPPAKPAVLELNAADFKVLLIGTQCSECIGAKFSKLCLTCVADVDKTLVEPSAALMTEAADDTAELASGGQFDTAEA